MKKNVIRVPFEFFFTVKKICKGIAHEAHQLCITGFAKKHDDKIVADIDNVLLNNECVKKDLEMLNAMNEIETAASKHVREIFQSSELQLA